MEGGTIAVQQRTAVSLDDILEARDRRAERQAALNASHRTPMISFTLNMPGNVKRTPLSSFFFDDRLARLKAQLQAIGAVIEEEIISADPTGDEAILAVSCLSSHSLKELAMAMEERSIAGRLLDIDVLDEEGIHVRRTSVGGEPRRCLLCERPASVCSFSRTHSLDELTEEVTHMLEKAVSDALVDKIVGLASKASSFELMVSMKPGLVTYSGSGSHADMDRFTFAKSQASLLSYYGEAFLAGWWYSGDDSDILDLRLKGMGAEQRMFQATGGINTHRGWIYLAGTLSAAFGRIAASIFRGNGHPCSECGVSVRLGAGNAETLLSDTAAAVARALEDSLESKLFGHVRRNMAIHHAYAASHAKKSLTYTHLKGMRGEAVCGFPSIFHVGLPLLYRSFKRGESEDVAGQRAILALLASTEDTTLGKRGGRSAITQVRRKIMSMLDIKSGPTEEDLVRSVSDLDKNDLQAHLNVLSEYFLGFHLSCGGVADLLAGSYLTFDLCLLIERLSAFG